MIPGITPSPWRWWSPVPGVRDGDLTHQDRTGDQMRILIGSNGQGFAHVGCTVGLSAEQDVANADLMAAAPDMYEALRAVLSFFAEDFGDDAGDESKPIPAFDDLCVTRGYYDAFVAARAALAKAVGESEAEADSPEDEFERARRLT